MFLINSFHCHYCFLESFGRRNTTLKKFEIFFCRPHCSCSFIWGYLVYQDGGVWFDVIILWELRLHAPVEEGLFGTVFLLPVFLLLLLKIFFNMTGRIFIITVVVTSVIVSRVKGLIFYEKYILCNSGCNHTHTLLSAFGLKKNGLEGRVWSLYLMPGFFAVNEYDRFMIPSTVVNYNPD